MGGELYQHKITITTNDEDSSITTTTISRTVRVSLIMLILMIVGPLQMIDMLAHGGRLERAKAPGGLQCD